MRALLLPVSHMSPVYPGGQEHVKFVVPAVSVQVPPLMQGLLKQRNSEIKVCVVQIFC